MAPSLSTSLSPEPMISMRPEAQLESANFALTANRIADGDDDGHLLEQALALLAAAERRMAVQREKIAQLELLVQTDPLTGLPNRRAFENALYTALAAARRHREAGALAFVDLDNFKTVNDTLGREAGDQVLIRVAEVLASQVRATDLVARYGGDEFVVMLTRAEPVEAEKRLKRLQTIVNTSYATFNSTRIHVRASFGIIAYGSDDSAETVLQKADAAMFTDKRLAPRSRPMAEGGLAS
jgi:diguanylate cyclase (GGDEF)-like protein